jgi:putative ABC transport system permease protein
MGMRLVAGRWWTETEDANGAPVVLVNESFARAYFPDVSPVGRQLDMGGGPQEVVGVIADVRHAGLDADPVAEFYGSYRGALSQFSARGVSLAVRATGDPAAFAPFVRQTVQALDPDVPLDDVMTMEARLAGSVARPRFYALVLGLFSVVAATLAALGIYGILAYLVSQRRREIGIRLAVGAGRPDILALVVRHGAMLVAVGLVAGLVGAVALTRLMQGMLFGVSPTDPATFVAVPIALAAVGLLACYGPALRATRVDPVSVLRAE